MFGIQYFSTDHLKPKIVCKTTRRGPSANLR